MLKDYGANFSPAEMLTRVCKSRVGWHRLLGPMPGLQDEQGHLLRPPPGEPDLRGGQLCGAGSDSESGLPGGLQARRSAGRLGMPDVRGRRSVAPCPPDSHAQPWPRAPTSDA
eukprot:11217159-Heterocapsa_arctica.AAC.1